ncbi:hypothetical protein N657DRAFT_453524 [Parathielavia appendiculata]|uniref:Uncharacterized protein n=1 Tax=Parathielavia appendiculata TaxID=2587402 RepID=A0AAN6TZP5_9PEZI|nr:hypothetical protein N657DRAFT_453524 [Parathielavia appendiculata]
MKMRSTKPCWPQLLRPALWLQLYRTNELILKHVIGGASGRHRPVNMKLSRCSATLPDYVTAPSTQAFPPILWHQLPSENRSHLPELGCLRVVGQLAISQSKLKAQNNVHRKGWQPSPSPAPSPRPLPGDCPPASDMPPSHLASASLQGWLQPITNGRCSSTLSL